jgi:transposase-like protein
MIDFPITELLDDAVCVAWLEQHLRLVCPRCQSTERRLFRRHDHFPTYRCRECQRTYTILTGTVFAKTRQSPATIVMLLRGIAKGESTARLSRELDLDRKRLGEIRQQIQTNLYDTLPGEVMSGTAFEADERCIRTPGKKVGLIATRPTHRVDVPINARAKAAMPTTGRRS